MNDNHDTDKVMAKMIAAICVRNTYLEELHSGTCPSSKTGDYSDVKVVTPYGEIPWNELSRFNNAEMKTLMKDVVNKIYTFNIHSKDSNFMSNFLDFAANSITEWDEPQLDKGLSKMKHKE